MNNPFSLTFGKQPQSLIGRDQQIDEIVSSFTATVPDYQVCMLTGVRGVGKTVFLTSVANELRQNKDWLVLDLSPMTKGSVLPTDCFVICGVRHTASRSL